MGNAPGGQDLHLYMRPDGYLLAKDLVKWEHQKAIGVEDGEERLTEEILKERYQIAHKTLDKYRREVLDLIRQTHRLANAVCIAQTDVIVATKRLYDDAMRLYGDAEDKGDFNQQFKILKDLIPVVLDRLQNVVPKDESHELTGFAGNNKTTAPTSVPMAVIQQLINTGQARDRDGAVLAAAREE